MGACDGTEYERVVVAVEMRAGGVVVDIHVGHAPHQLNLSSNIQFIRAKHPQTRMSDGVLEYSWQLHKVCWHAVESHFRTSCIIRTIPTGTARGMAGQARRTSQELEEALVRGVGRAHAVLLQSICT